jgi:hypothetical protein
MPLAVLIPIAVIAAAALALAAAYWLGYAPLDRLRPMRASASEASEYTQDLAAEFFEWVRTGR